MHALELVDSTLPTEKSPQTKRSVRWRANHLDHAKAQCVAWRIKHTANVKAYNAAYRATHLKDTARVKVYNAAYRATHPKKKAPSIKSASKRGRPRAPDAIAWYRHKKYGLTREAFTAIFQTQNSCCAICGNELELWSAHSHIDHDHKTGRVRGILCHHCNIGLGNFRDNSTSLAAVITYLEGGRVSPR